ncbi:hypothetical protein Nepgr_031019 [Nepenthes gracilis]|uniref:Uncharacterized protein n=1 Tax=Nepenthes gracilis TaxID=150966 RepID=A0AAD3Y758_NEPGR|nr:hypothetical protein Nepgr_031019 [Nepenthes gracilis]
MSNSLRDWRDAGVQTQATPCSRSQIFEVPHPAIHGFSRCSNPSVAIPILRWGIVTFPQKKEIFFPRNSLNDR